MIVIEEREKHQATTSQEEIQDEQVEQQHAEGWVSQDLRKWKNHLEEAVKEKSKMIQVNLEQVEAEINYLGDPVLQFYILL